MRRPVRLLLLLVSWVCQTAVSGGQEFSFSAQRSAENAREAQVAVDRNEAIRRLVSVPCQQHLKDQKILLLIAERTADSWNTAQERYGPQFQVIDGRLKTLGLKTYTQEQIRAQIAQAEVQAYFRNDPDAALSAAKRLAANYVLRGDITTRESVNQVVGVNQVEVSLAFTLSSADGRILSQVEAHSDAYSGENTLRTALKLVQEQADRLVAGLYNDYCSKAGGSSGGL
jgi:hypothetical protein